MADFSASGAYRFVYTDDSDEPISCGVTASDDADALEWARHVQHGMALEVWKGTACIERLPRPERFTLWLDTARLGAR